MQKVKQKTRKGALARFKITSTGKVLRRSQNARHRRRNKSKKAIRAYGVYTQMKGKIARKIMRMIGRA